MRAKLLMLFTPLFFFSNSALAEENSTVIFSVVTTPAQDSTPVVSEDEILVKNAIQKSVGRIIRIKRAGGEITALSTCSATLVENNVILTAAHCLRIKNVMLLRDRLKHEVSKLILNEKIELYFDIPGLTSQISNEELKSIATSKDKSEEAKKLEAYLSQLPKIKNYVLSEYNRRNPLKTFDSYSSRNLRHIDKLNSMMEEEQQNVEGIANDYAYARLSKPVVDGKPLPITAPNNETQTFITGFDGGIVGTSSLNVQTCSSGEEAMEIIAADILEQMLLIKLAKAYGTQHPIITEILDRQTNDLAIGQNNFERYHASTIVNACSRDIKKGNSGGPQISLQNGEVSIVGINSYLLVTAKYMIGSKAIDAKNSGIFNRLK